VKTIEIIIDAKGESTIQTKGFAGASCRDASKLLERALGERVSETLTGEFYQACTTDQQSIEQK
jgi:hypothetical protein